MVTSSRRSVSAARPWGSLISQTSTSPFSAGISLWSLPKNFPDPSRTDQTNLPLDVMGMDRQELTGLEIEIQDFEIRRFVDQQPFQRQVAKIIGLIQIDFFHLSLLFFDVLVQCAIIYYFFFSI